MLTTIKQQRDVVPVNTEKFLVLDKKTYCNVPHWSTNKKSQYDVVGVLEATDNDDLENKVNFGIQSIVNHFGVTAN